MTWFNNDREESKPSWLNTAQKRNCIRTVRGWEVPASNAYGNQFDGWKTNGATAYIPNLELIVSMPTDLTAGSITDGNMVGPGFGFFIRGRTGAYGDGYGGLPTNAGFTAESARDLPNYTPYFTCPFNIDSPTSGGPNGLGVTHNGSRGSGLSSGENYAYKTNKSGVSSLGLPRGMTAYIKVCVNDFNFSQRMTITHGSLTGFSLYTQNQLLDTALVPVKVYEEFFGPTSTVNNNIAVIRFTDKQATTGHASSNLKLSTDAGQPGFIVIGLSAGDANGAGVTADRELFSRGGTANGIVFTVRFDRF